MNQFLKRKRNALFLLISLLIGLLSSCNLFLSNPSLRENPNDDRRQITGFTAGPTGTTSITTVWNWTPPKDWLNSDERIDEIKITHSTLGYQEFNIPFVGQTFIDRTIWQYEWKDLKAGTAHYFSLFVKTEDGKWHQSYKTKVILPGTIKSSVHISRVDSLNIDDTGMEEWYPDSTLENGSLRWSVVFFDLPDDGYVTHATITLFVSGGSISDIQFVPLDGYLTGDGMTKWNSLSNGSILRESEQIGFTSNLGTFDITKVVRAAVSGPNHAILIKTDTSSFNLDNAASAPYITADLVE